MQTLTDPLTIVPSLLAWGVVELYVNLPVLPGLGPVLTVGSSFVGFVVDLCPKSMCELLCTAATFLTQKMAFSEVLTEIAVVTGTGGQLINKYNRIEYHIHTKAHYISHPTADEQKQ